MEEPTAAEASESKPTESTTSRGGAPVDAAPRPARLDAASAQIVAWLLIAMVNAAFVSRLGGKVTHTTRALHYLFDAGQLLAAGALAALAVRLWSRYVRRGDTWATAVLGLLSFVLAWEFVRPDLANFSERLGGNLADVLWVLSTLMVASWLPAAFDLGRRFRTPLRRWFVVAAVIGGAAANDRILPHDYRGAHLFVALTAAVFGATSLSGLELPRRIDEATARRLGVIANVFVGVIGLVTVVVPPPPLVQAELVRIDGAVVAPLISRVRRRIALHNLRVPDNAGAWFRDRRGEPQVAPTSPRIVSKDPIVLLITVDSMRASLFAESDKRAKLPRLEDLRNHAVDFTMARAPASRTVTTWGSVYTGKYYSGVAWHGINIARDATVRFPTLLGRAGVQTENFMSVDQLGASNMNAGFTEETFVPPRKGQTFATSTEVIPQIIARLEKGVPGPLFVFAHLMDPHFPYDSVTNKGPLFDRYLAEVGEADKRIGELLDAVDRLGLKDRTVVIIAADHGEAFGQHDTKYHTTTLYDELIRVPLFIRAPGSQARPIAQPVTLMDLGPTILDLFGVPTPGVYLGQSLVPFLRGENPALTRPIAAERVDTRAFIVGDHKIIVDTEKGTREVFDLSKDPKETTNILDELGPVGQAEIDTMQVFFEAHAWYAGGAP